MSWWDDGDDILGDAPADKLKAVWRTLLARRAEQGRDAPSTDETLESFAAALRRAELDGSFSALSLWRGSHKERDYAGAGGTKELIDLLVPALAAIGQDYRRQADRPPRAVEMAKTLEFIVEPRLDAYLSDASELDWQTLRLRAE
jgi:hypothetical protein